MFINDDDEPPKLSVQIYPYGGPQQSMDNNNPNRDPLIFVLLFINAESGFQLNISNSRENLSNNNTGTFCSDNELDYYVN